MPKKKSCVISDENINSYGFYLLTAGGDLGQFKKNPILLWMHNRAWRGTKDEVLPIGTVENIRVEGGQVLGDPVFDTADEFAAEIGRKWDAGILKMVSPGLEVIEYSNDPKYLKAGQTNATVTKWKLKELSIVDIGSNDNAIAFYDGDGKMITLADNPGQTVPVPKLSETKINNEMGEMIKLADGTEMTAQQVQNLRDDNAAHTATVATLTTERDNYKTKAEAFELADKNAKKAEATALVDAAIADGRVDATPGADGKSAKENWLRFFESSHDDAKAALAAIPKRQLVAPHIGEGGEDERTQLEKLSWDEIDRQGKQYLVKTKYWDLYEQKFEQKFGNKPKK